jgi:ABC-2 type transport system permease protein
MIQQIQSRLKFSLNPFTAHELRSLMRGPRAYLVLTVYLSIVSGITLLLYIATSGNGTSGVNDSSSVGSALFYVIIGMQTLLVSFLTPSFTAGALNGEREQGTYDLLWMTGVTPTQIVVGKLMASVGYTFLLVLATLPLLSLALLLGGVELIQLAVALTVILMSALLFSSLGLYISARMPTMLGSTIVTYALATAIVIGMAVFTLISFPLINDLIYGSSSIVKTSPFLGVLLQLVMFLTMSISPISAMVASEANLQESGNAWLISIAPLPGSPPTIDIPSPFVILLILYVVVSVLLLWRTIKRLASNTDWP